MRIVEIPLKTIEDELNKLHDTVTNDYGAAYIAGAIEALEWIQTGKISPTELIERNRKVVETPSGLYTH